tara:strand:+ start:83 stop:490 length:408 start_codon:yes stop_codon:yes gene_type:complete
VTQSIIKSLAITLGISILCAASLLVFDITFWKSFLVITAIQFSLWNLVQYVLEWRTKLASRKLEVELLSEISKQGVDIPCGYCKVKNFVPIRFDDTNDFECIDCKKVSSVYIEIESAAKTDPIDAEPLKVNNVGQ